MKPEQEIHKAVCNYLRLQYPDVVFFSEPSGLRVTIGQAVLLKKLRSFGKLPDLFIAEPKGINHGLFIELKVKPVLLKNGNLSSNPHIQEQNAMLDRLRVKGYYATFGIGFEDCKNIIDTYLSK